MKQKQPFNLLINSIFLCLACISSISSANTPQIVTIISDDSYPPYSYVENGKAAGIYVDLVMLAAKRLAEDYTVIIKPMPWKRGLQELKMGKEFAILPPFIHSNKRDYIWPYSKTLSYERVVAFCQKDIELKAYLSDQPNPDAKPINVGINAGFLILNEQFTRAQEINVVDVWENRSTRANVQKLINKRLDCYLNDPLSTQWVLNQLMKKDPTLSFDNIEQMLEVMVQTAHVGYTNRKNDKFHFRKDFIKRFDKALSVVKRDNGLEKIIRKYVKQ